MNKSGYVVEYYLVGNPSQPNYETVEGVTTPNQAVRVVLQFEGEENVLDNIKTHPIH